MDTFIEAMVAYCTGILRGDATGEAGIAFPEQLRRAELNYSLESVHLIDEYLLQVHAKRQSIALPALANTIMCTAFYLGEVIRRRTPAAECQWGRSRRSKDDPVTVGVVVGEVADFVLRSGTSGRTLTPVDEVMALYQTGPQAPTLHAYAMTAIKRIWVETSGQSDPNLA